MANEIIEDLGYPVQVERFEPGEYNPGTGKWTQGAITTVDIIAAIIPLSRQDTANELAAVGLEDKDAVAVYTEFQLLESEIANKQQRDIILWNDRRYVVQSCVPRMQLEDIAHYKAIAVLKDS